MEPEDWSSTSAKFNNLDSAILLGSNWIKPKPDVETGLFGANSTLAVTWATPSSKGPTKSKSETFPKSNKMTKSDSILICFPQ